MGNLLVLFFYLPALVVLTQMYGAIGAAAATLACALMTVVAMSVFTGVQLRHQAEASSCSEHASQRSAPS